MCHEPSSGERAAVLKGRAKELERLAWTLRNQADLIRDHDRRPGEVTLLLLLGLPRSDPQKLLQCAYELNDCASSLRLESDLVSRGDSRAAVVACLLADPRAGPEPRWLVQRARQLLERGEPERQQERTRDGPGRRWRRELGRRQLRLGRRQLRVELVGNRRRGAAMAVRRRGGRR
jgi:hypothetical protein